MTVLQRNKRPAFDKGLLWRYGFAKCLRASSRTLYVGNGHLDDQSEGYVRMPFFEEKKR